MNLYSIESIESIESIFRILHSRKIKQNQRLVKTKAKVNKIREPSFFYLIFFIVIQWSVLYYLTSFDFPINIRTKSKYLRVISY